MLVFGSANDLNAFYASLLAVAPAKTEVKVGTTLYGYCGGAFGDDYDEKRVEALGADWIVVRNSKGQPLFAANDDPCTTAEGFHDWLAEYTEPKRD